MITIPGYRMLRQLGRGGMATVYLALQESVQREVALKVMSPALAGDEFGERFLREARIAASLRHPHVVQVHDVGRSGDWHYMAMEYLGGGPALQRQRVGDVGYALRITREIADALAYAHARGVIHRDIKPDNLLLRDDGSAVLTDFGIARAGDASRMTQAGTIMGTPHYMAPEQATGSAIDGRADLYSLGVVFHELLLGRVPFDADDWVAVGLMHISAPVPPLPPQFASLQPLLDHLLAKTPEQRFRNGAELAEAIEHIEDCLAERNGGVKPRRSGRVHAVSPPSAVEAAQASESAEPTLGRLDHLPERSSARSRRARPTPAPHRRRSTLVLATLALLGLLAAAAFHWQAPLRELLLPRYETVLQQAEQALAEDRLSAADGSGASELFQRALAQNPDDARARAGQLAVGERYLERAEQALAEERRDDARVALAAARAQGIAGSRIAPIEQRLLHNEDREAELMQLLQAAQAALAADRIDDGDADSALALYQRALLLAPDNRVVRHGLRETLSRLLARAGESIAAGQLDAAGHQIDAVAAIDATHLDLASRRSQLAQARQQRQGALQQRLDEAEALLRRGRLTTPAGGNAREAFQAILAGAPDQPEAMAGLRRVADALLLQAERASADFRFDEARVALDQARTTLPTHPGLGNAEKRLRELQARGARITAAPPGDPQRLARDLEAAATALREGRLVHPPGESAFDLYKSVLRADPRNATAEAGIAALPAAARRHFEEALGRNRFNAAMGYLQGLETVAPGDSALPDMRHRLARSLLGFANERLGAGELQRARDALQLAAELEPGNAELPALRARLEQAQP
jgi:serine/threonine-protein kinase PpkA